MNRILYPACALFAWTVVLTSVRYLPVMRKQPARLATWTMYVFFALIFTTGWSVVWSRVDAWTGLAETNTLITMCWVVCYSASALILLQVWSYEPSRARRRAMVTGVGAAAVLVVMVALFLHCDTQHQHQQSFTAWYAGSLEYEAYLLVYLTAFTAVEIEIIRLCRRYARLTTRSWLRTGLITAGIGAAIGLFYSLTRLADIAAARAGLDISGWEDVAEVGAGLGALLVMVGLTLHSWGPRASTALLRVRRLHAYTRLRPLWAAFYVRDPGIAFDDRRAEPAGRVAARARAALRVLKDPEYHLARRVVEILDVILAARPYLDPAVTERARAHYRSCGLDGNDLDAVVVATQIHHTLGVNVAAPRRSTLNSPATGNTPADLDAEIAWLLKVTTRFTRHPSHVAEAGSPDPTPTGGTP